MSAIERYLDPDSWIVSAIQLGQSGTLESLIFVVHSRQATLEVVQRLGSTGIYAYDSAPGARWTCSEFLTLLQEPGEAKSYTASGSAKITVDILQLDWFMPLIRKMAEGKAVSYEEADGLHRLRFHKPLRLYPTNAHYLALNDFQLELDYGYMDAAREGE